MSLKTRTKVQTFKPMVYKPSENGIGQGKLEVSNRSNDRKFMFLSEETKPDYRPVGDNCNSRQAESSFQRTTTNYVDNSKYDHYLHPFLEDFLSTERIGPLIRIK